MQAARDISQLAAAIESIQHRTRLDGETHLPPSAFISTGWPEIDHTLGGGFMRGAVHEWFTESPLNLPPLAILIHLAWRAMESSSHTHPSSLIIWIGKRCWPHPRAMTRPCDASLADAPNDHRLLDRSLFIDPPDDASRLWAIDLALRSLGTRTVIADGSDFDMAATRRLQLAAGVGRTPALLVRPLRDLRRLSGATTRWMINPGPPEQLISRKGAKAQRQMSMDSATQPLHAFSPLREIAVQSFAPRWTIELLRCKGVRPVMPGPTRWALELNHVTGALDLHAPLVHRLAETA